MKKVSYVMLFVFIGLTFCALAHAKEWYEGGTLHETTIAQWKKAAKQNKIATCADWISALYMNSKLNLLISGLEDLKKCTVALVDYIDEASKNTKSLDKENTNSVALLGMMFAGWFREGDNSDLLAIIKASKPKFPLQSAENAEQKLKANGFLLDDEVETVFETEKTPGILEKLSEAQKKAIAEELKKAEEDSEESSQGFGTSITDKLEKSMYQEAVRKNKVLKAVRAIAKKYGIQAGDVFSVEESLLPLPLLADDSEGYAGSNVIKLFDYPPAVNRKRYWVMDNIFVDTKWEPSAMVKRFGKYEQYNHASGNPKIIQMFYFKDIDMTFIVNMLSFKIVTWRSGRADS